MQRCPGPSTLAVLTLAACSSVSYSNSRLDALQTELNRSYALWKDLHIPSYDYHFERTCACDSIYIRPVTVSVVDSVLAGVVYADSGAAVPDSTLRSYFTVEGLFYQVQAAINLQPDSLGVEYDPVYHYPARIVVDQDFRRVGDELGLFASGLTPKQP